MSQNDPNRYTKLSAAQLEDMLRQPRISETEQQLIQEELTKRYMADLLKGTKAEPQQPIMNSPEAKPAQPKQPEAKQPQPSQPEPSLTSQLPRQEVISAPQAPTRNQRGRGCIWIALLIIIGILIFAFNNRSSSSSSYGTVCATNVGSCPMQVQLPKGALCTCFTPSGQYSGIVR
jgi:hypothetical protein